ncbi:hydrolase [Pontibacter sp. JAM-7]|uniref:hydrolase n=1 Tax=Pontibacter sp. JAM-7 TaxID=3366581 RepID=UPI003AF9CD35
MLIHPNKSCLLIVDVQQKLLPAVETPETLVKNVRWLGEIAQHLNVPVLISEQYPQGLGHTAAELQALQRNDNVMSKTFFSCMSEADCNQQINALRPNQVIITGMEAHVCVLQTAIQLKQQAREVYVVADCVASRNPADKALALERMRQCGIYVVSREMVAFEWLQKSDTAQFRYISKNYIR